MPLDLSPEELAEADRLSGVTPEERANLTPPAQGGINPIRDFSADELFQLAVADKDNFDLPTEFRRHKDLWKDPATIQKVADVQDRLEERGFELSDLPGPGKVMHTMSEIGKGLLKQAWNYANVAATPIVGLAGMVTGQSDEFQKELIDSGSRRLAENVAGTEAAMLGIARLGEKGVDKAVRMVRAPRTAEERVQNLWTKVGKGEVEEDITRGKGGFLTAAGGKTVEQLEAAGTPVRPEEVTTLAAGDPFSFFTFGKMFQGLGKLVPKKVTAVAEKGVRVADKAAEVAGGRAVQAAGVLTDLGGRAVKIAAPAVGMVKGAIEAGPLGALAGLKGGEIAAKTGGMISKGGKALAKAGKEIAGASPVTGNVTQLAKDVIGSVPTAAFEVGKGYAVDLGMAALTSEGPRDTESVGIGAFFGGLGAVKRVGPRIISGQLVGPREWGSHKNVPSSGQFPRFDAMHSEVIRGSSPSVKTRSNAIREFLKGANNAADSFLLPSDKPTAERHLVDAGFSPERAKTLAAQDGFFMADMPGKDGKPRRIILMRNIDAAPHEAFHPIQDVLGETANQAIDQIVREEYGQQWEQEGQRYASRIGEGDWREVVLDSTNTGLNYAKEKIAMDVGNEYRAATGAEPTSEYVQTRAKEIFGQVMDRAVQANPDVSPNDIAGRVWRDILSPQEATAVADSYLARELAAENFDMVFKQGGDLQNVSGLTGRLARIVAQLVSALGGEPLSQERVSQIGQIAPRFRVTEAVREAATGLVQPREAGAPASRPTVTTTPNEPLPNTPSSESEAQKIAAEAPENPITAGAASPREILGNVAEAIAQQAGLKVNYLSAPGEPAGAITSNRAARRDVIEAFRTMPAEARALWEKNFFPDRVIKLKGDKYQILGWAPEVFAANAHKLAAKLQELGVAESSPYPVKDGTFTPEGWQELFKDTQTFVQNQMGGRTGAGESLVVPRNVAERGFYAPPIRGQAEALPQLKADFINMLFGFKIPDTARVQKGKLPLNLAGQAVSEATQPGRTEIPVIPRGRFEGAEAERQGIAGQDIMEVNPLRQQIEAAAQAKGVAMPEFIEAQQRLNLESIKDVQVAPEQPQFRGNTLTLSAGFQPQTAKGKEVSDAGFDFESYGFRGTRGVRILKDGVRVGDISSAMLDPKQPNTADVSMVYVDEGFRRKGLGEALYRELATELQKDGVTELLGDTVSEEPVRLRNKVFGPSEILPPEHFDSRTDKVKSRIEPSATFQPKAQDIAVMDANEFRKWTESLGPGKGFTPVAIEMGKVAENPDTLKVTYDALLDQAREVQKQAIASKDIPKMEEASALISKAQFFREAWESATGVGSASQKNLDAAAVQMQPKKELKLKPAGRDGVSKVWVLPDGKVVNIGGQWHHEYLNDNPALRKQYKLSDDTSQDNRLGALQKGFARLNWSYGSGHLTIEARTKDWPKQREAIRSFVEANADKIDRMQVVLMSDNLKKVDDAHEVSVFTMEDNEKAAALPFGDLGDKRATGDASDRLFEKAASKAQLQPQEGDVGQRMDQRSRRRARGGRWWMQQAQREPALGAELGKIQSGDSSGQTFTKDGEVWSPGDKQVDIVTVASVNVPTKDLTAEKYAEAIAPYKELLDDPNVVAGVFSLNPETTSIDINAVVPQEHRDNTKAFAKANDQMSIWDAVKFETVETGGAGETKLKSVPQIKAALENLTQGKPVSVEDITAQFQPKGDKEKVTSAAIRYGKKVYEGATHPEAYDAALADGKTEDATFESGFVTSTERFISADEAWVLGKGTKPPTGGAHSEDLDIQFQPSGEKNLFGAEEAKRSLSSSEVANMSLKALREYYPEATVPSKDELIPSEILKSPLYKEAGGEAEAVQAFADRLGEFYESVKIDPVVKAGLEWYDKFTPMLKKEFGDDAQIFAELLAATSPQTSIDTNFKYSVDALEGLKSGRFKKVISKFEQGLEMIAKDTWKAWYNKELKNIPKPPVKPTAATFLEHWIDKHDLKPKQSNGKLYGIHSLPVLRVFARQWLVKTTGPKTQNFVENLIGKSDEATIDMWADRTMRRIGYEGVERWRILPKNAAPVADKDFYFAQKSFRRAAEKLGLRPSALQGALWFAEKQLWAKNGWSRLDLGDFRDQMENLPAIRQSIKKDLTSTQPSRKVKELDLELVQPRKKNERY